MDKAAFRRSARKILPWLVTILLLAIVFLKVDFEKILENINAHTVRNVAILAVSFYTYIFFANVLIYHQIFRRVGKPVPYLEILRIRGASYLLTAVNPGVGQGGMALWISRKWGIPLKEVVGLMLLLPVVDIATLAIILSASLFANYLTEPMLSAMQVKIISGVVAAMWIALIAHFAFWHTGISKKFKAARESALVCGFRKAKPADYAVLLGIRMTMNVGGVFAFYFGLALFGVNLPLWVFVARFFPAFLLQAIPISVGQYGTSQGAWILMYQDLASKEALAAFSLVWITIYNISRVVIGAIFFRGEARHYFERELKQTETQNNMNKSEG